MTNKYECAKCGTIFNSNNRETCPSCKTKAVEEVEETAIPFSAGTVGHIGTSGNTAISKPPRSTANYKEIDYLREISSELREANRHLSFLHNLGMLYLVLFLLGTFFICIGLFRN